MPRSLKRKRIWRNNYRAWLEDPESKQGWITAQKFAWRNNGLTYYQRQLLTKAGVTPEITKSRDPVEPNVFARRLERLKGFIRRNGNLNVPPRESTLYNWMWNVRYERRRLSLEQWAALDALGFDWKAKYPKVKKGEKRSRKYETNKM